MDEKDYNVPIQNIDYNKIFLLSDLHFGVRANSLEWLTNQLIFFENFYFPFLKEKAEKGDVFFMLGDWFDNRQLLDINVMNKAIDIIYKISQIMPVYLMTGNHDIYKKNETDVNSLIAFRFIPNVFVIEEPTIITNGKSNILVLPWIGDKEEEEAYAKANSKKAEFIFAHTDMAGFKYDNGRSIVKGVNLHDIKGYKKIFSGHIHKRQQIDHTFYIGSPYHTKRGDIGNQKGVYIFEPNKNKLEFTENNLSSVFQRIKLEDLMEWTLDYTYKVLENNYTDIIVPDKYIHLFNLTKFIELLKDCTYKKIETVGEKVRTDDDFNGIVDGQDIKDILTLLEMSIDELGLSMEILVKLKMLNKLYYEKASKDEETWQLSEK
jgi:DNA repair exonuclease SbcCD nuclease subunit